MFFGEKRQKLLVKWILFTTKSDGKGKTYVKRGVFGNALNP